MGLLCKGTKNIFYVQFYVQKSYFSLFPNTFKVIPYSCNYLNISDIKMKLTVSEYNICSSVLGTEKKR